MIVKDIYGLERNLEKKWQVQVNYKNNWWDLKTYKTEDSANDARKHLIEEGYRISIEQGEWLTPEYRVTKTNYILHEEDIVEVPWWKFW